MAERVFFVHGVATHEADGFVDNVTALNEKLPGYDFVPIFWGDLAARSDFLADTLPVIDPTVGPGGGVRGEDGTAVDPVVRKLLAGGGGSQTRGGANTADIIADHAAGSAGAALVRSSEAETGLRDTIRAEVAGTRYLQFVDDPQTLAAAGRLIGTAGVPQSDGAETRSFLPPGALAGLQAKVKQAVAHVDDLLGSGVGYALGRANQNLRAAIADPFANFFGDIFVYQRNQAAIHERIWNRIQAQSPGAGTKDNPINLVAHSLGGVVCFDMAIHGTQNGAVPADPVGGRGPLWVRSFVTFGSQSSFFHLLDRRQELAAYQHGSPVALPPTIAKWTNLWDSMDILAFTAGVVFQLAAGGRPEDVPVYDKMSLLAAEKGWTHSIYWQTPQLVEGLKAALA